MSRLLDRHRSRVLLREGRRTAQMLLGRVPRVYRALLERLHRGSPEKCAFLALVRRGDVVLDVGANEGYFTVLFSHLVGSRGLVYAFEPVPSTFARLGTRVREEAWFDNVRATAAACGDTDGDVSLLVPGNDWEQASLVRHAAGSWAAQAPVTAHAARVIRLDGFLCGTPAHRISLAKIDVEGAELLVLRGLGTLLAAQRPLVCLELSSAWTSSFGYAPRDVLDLLMAAGYDDFMIVDDLAAGNVDAIVARASRESINIVCGMRALHADRLDALAR